MGQDNIYQLLRKHRNKWLASKEIAQTLNIGYSSVSTALRKLRHRGRVYIKSAPGGKKKYWYMAKD